MIEIDEIKEQNGGGAEVSSRNAEKQSWLDLDVFFRPWLKDAACGDCPDPEWFWSNDPTQQALAKSYCAECPVRIPCLELALEDEKCMGAGEQSRNGIWGGTTPAERRKTAETSGSRFRFIREAME